MSLMRIVQLRDAVRDLCAGIDKGEIQVDEATMLAIAEVLDKEAGPLRHDLLVQIASRSHFGSLQLKKMAH